MQKKVSVKTVKPKKQQRGGFCKDYADIKDAFPTDTQILDQVKVIVQESVMGSPPMNEAKAQETADVVIDTVKQVSDTVPSSVIENVVKDAISDNNVQMGGKSLRKKKVVKSKKVAVKSKKIVKKPKSKSKKSKK